jgi:peroxiredoxin
VTLPSTSNTPVDLSTLAGLTILFCYPRTGAPGETIPASWNSIPGARGCTPQACSFRDATAALLDRGVKHLFGLSTQDSEYQREAKQRLHLPYELLSDEKLEFVGKLGLPTFEWEGRTLVKRLALAIEDGTVVKVWYPVFPPDRNAGDVVEWLEGRK